MLGFPVFRVRIAPSMLIGSLLAHQRKPFPCFCGFSRKKIKEARLKFRSHPKVSTLLYIPFPFWMLHIVLSMYLSLTWILSDALSFPFVIFWIDFTVDLELFSAMLCR